MSTADEPVCLVDASLYIFRAYHSLPPDWHARDGWPTNAVQGFASFLLQLLEQGQHSHMAVCFDEALDSGFRHEIYPAYKAMGVSEDYIEGPKAFAEKRPPNWKGR